MKNIEASKLRKEYNIIDIRDKIDYLNGHIYNAINISENELIKNYFLYLNKNDTYYIYCKKGISSKKVCNILNALGYDVINVYGGYASFK